MIKPTDIDLSGMAFAGKHRLRDFIASGLNELEKEIENSRPRKISNGQLCDDIHSQGMKVGLDRAFHLIKSKFTKRKE